MRSALGRGLYALWLVLSAGYLPAAAALPEVKGSTRAAHLYDPDSSRDPMKEPEWKRKEREERIKAKAEAEALAISTDTLKDAPSAVPLPPPTVAAKKQKAGIVPVANIWLLGGESSYGGDADSRTGSASVLTGLSVPIGDNWKFLPTYQGYYEATQQILNAGLGNALIQQRMDHRFSAKVVYDLPGTPHRMKVNAGYRTEMLKETRDEPWGEGLFDYYKPSVGLEYEFFYQEPYSVRASYDMFTVRYPHYVPLESKGALSVNGQTVARELTGGHVLDSNNHLFQLGGTGRMGRAQGMWDVWYAFNLQDYPEQPLVDSQGQLRARKRRDLSNSVNLSLRGAQTPGVPHKIDGGVRTSFASVQSNQNNYDAFRTQFFGRYYSYREFKINPHTTVHFKNPTPGLKTVRISLSLDTTQRWYPNRTVQAASGKYRHGNIWTQTRTTSLTLVWPIGDHISLMGTYRRYAGKGNSDYEVFYRYNYQTTAYMFGLGYEW